MTVEARLGKLEALLTPATQPRMWVLNEEEAQPAGLTDEDIVVVMHRSTRGVAPQPHPGTQAD